MLDEKWRQYSQAVVKSSKDTHQGPVLRHARALRQARRGRGAEAVRVLPVQDAFLTVMGAWVLGPCRYWFSPRLHSGSRSTSTAGACWYGCELKHAAITKGQATMVGSGAHSVTRQGTRLLTELTIRTRTVGISGNPNDCVRFIHVSFRMRWISSFGRRDPTRSE